MKKSKIITFRREYQSRDLVEFKGRFYPQEVSAPPKVCIGWGDGENPPLLQLKLRTPLQFSCRDLRG